MKKEEWNEALNHLDSNLVEKYVRQKDKLRQNDKKGKGIWIRFGAIAACFALIFGAVQIIPSMKKNTLPIVPTWDTAYYSAEDVANVFDFMKNYDSATNAYTKIYVPDEKYLYTNSVIDDEYLSVYQRMKAAKALSRLEFQFFIDAILPKLSDSLDVHKPNYKITEENDILGNRLFARADVGPYHIWTYQNSARNSFNFRKNEGEIIMDGEAVRIDQRLSDEEILESLQSIKNKLFSIFNVSFSDVKVIRRFDSYSKNGAETVYIYFYDESAHYLNSTASKPISDYICISFDNAMNYSGDIVSDDILKICEISYSKLRISVDNEYLLVMRAKKISISDAEALLYNGYVFGGHSCRLCMEEQDKVSFKGYDFVGIEYVFGYNNTGEPSDIIPFYAFYKNIGTSKNGNTIYAKTYVPAVEVRGLEAYFQNQISKH